jgi:Family of unknown function (DUF6526)
MPENGAQNFGNHRRYVPGFHFVTSAILIFNVAWGIFRLYRAFRWSHPAFNKVDDGVELLVAIGLCLLFLYIRNFPLAVQDRLIRHEMRTRLAAALPADLQARIGELSSGQLIAMRFAGDDEIVSLTREVLDKQIRDRNTIKKMIRNWQPDTMRA